MNTIDELEHKLAEPSRDLIEDIASLDGDLMVLGAGGKVGPGLARLAGNAFRQAGLDREVIAVSRFSSSGIRERLRRDGIKTVTADLLDDHQLQSLPRVENIIYMVGTKFGTTGNEHLTWTVNAYLPGRVASKFKDARIVAFSTGNVYPLTPVAFGGASEDDPTGPVGEYAQSCLGRERVFEHFSLRFHTPVLFFRLNYAVELRYGVLLDVAQAVKNRETIDLRMGHVNVIWQGDASEWALRALKLCDCPPEILNVTGPETVSVRWLAEQFGKLLGVEPVFEHFEQDNALLSNASKAHRIFGYPRVSLQEMIEWTAHWIKINGPTLGKPTHFQERKGEF